MYLCRCIYILKKHTIILVGDIYAPTDTCTEKDREGEKSTDFR